MASEKIMKDFEIVKKDYLVSCLAPYSESKLSVSLNYFITFLSYIKLIAIQMILVNRWMQIILSGEGQLIIALWLTSFEYIYKFILAFLIAYIICVL